MASWEVTETDINNEWSNSVGSNRLQTAATAANNVIGNYKTTYSGQVTSDDAEIMALWLAIHFAKAGQPDLQRIGDRQVVLPDINDMLTETQEGRRLITYDPAGQLKLRGRQSASLTGYGPRDDLT